MDTTILTEYAEKALHWVEDTASFISGEIPVYIEELLKWRSVEALMDIGFWFLVMIPFVVGIALMVRSAKKGWSTLDEYDKFQIGAIIAVLVLGAFGCILGMAYPLKDVVYIATAPRVYLVEYLGSLLTK